MTELRPSLAQQEFIAKEIRHRRQVVIVRFMLLVLLLALWELAADFGWIPWSASAWWWLWAWRSPCYSGAAAACRKS